MELSLNEKSAKRRMSSNTASHQQCPLVSYFVSRLAMN